MEKVDNLFRHSLIQLRNALLTRRGDPVAVVATLPRRAEKSLANQIVA
jgi:hypothetical protein